MTLEKTILATAVGLSLAGCASDLVSPQGLYHDHIATRKENGDAVIVDPMIAFFSVGGYKVNTMDYFCLRLKNISMFGVANHEEADVILPWIPDAKNKNYDVVLAGHSMGCKDVRNLAWDIYERSKYDEAYDVQLMMILLDDFPMRTWIPGFSDTTPIAPNVHTVLNLYTTSIYHGKPLCQKKISNPSTRVVDVPADIHHCDFYRYDVVTQINQEMQRLLAIQRGVVRQSSSLEDSSYVTYSLPIPQNVDDRRQETAE